MPHMVELSNGDTAEFPDSMSADQIKAVLLKKFPPDNSFGAEMQRTGSALKNYFTSLPGRVGDTLQQAGNEAPGEIAGVLKDIPGTRNFKRIGAGLADIGGDILNFASQAGNVDPANPKARVEPQNKESNFTPAITNKFGLQNPEAGDALLRGAVHNLPLIMPAIDASKSLYSGAKGILSKGAGEKELSAAEEAAKLSDSSYAAAKEQEQIAKAQSKIDIGKQTPEDIQRDISNKEATLSNVNNHVDALTHQMENLPPVTPGNATEAAQQAEHHLNAANELNRSSALAADKAEKDIGEYLHENKEHDVEAARMIDKTHTETKKQIGKGYDSLEKSLAEKEIKVNDPDAVKNKTAALMELIKANEARSPEASRIISELEDLQSGKSINAKDYLVGYRSASQYAREARQKAFQSGMNAEERAHWQQQYQELDEKVDEMGKTLEENIGGEDYSKLKELNSLWRDKVIPVERNNIYQRLKKYKQMPDNIVKSLRGDEKGNVLIRNIIQNNPDINRLVVGQRYAAKADEIHNANGSMTPYIQKLPELQKMQEYRQNVLDTQAKAEENIQLAKANHKLALEAEKNQLAEAGDLDKEQESIRKQLGKHNDLIIKIQNQLPLLKEHLEKTKQARNLTHQSLQKKLAAEKAYKEALEKYNGTQGKLKKMMALVGAIGKKTAYAGGFGSAAYLGKKAYNALDED